MADDNGGSGGHPLLLDKVRYSRKTIINSSLNRPVTIQSSSPRNVRGLSATMAPAAVADNFAAAVRRVLTHPGPFLPGTASNKHHAQNIRSERLTLT